MWLVVQLVDLLFAAYALALLVYLVLPRGGHPRLVAARRALTVTYEHVLFFLRAYVRPVRLGMSTLDPSPLVLLVGIIVARTIINYLLIGRV